MPSCENFVGQRRTIFDDFWSKCSTNNVNTSRKSGFSSENAAYGKSNMFKLVKYNSDGLDSHSNDFNTALCYLTPTREKKASDKYFVKRSQYFDAHQEDIMQRKKSVNGSLNVRTVRFHPRVHVQLIDTMTNSESTNKSYCNWYTAEELTSFRLEATSVLRQHKTRICSSKDVIKPSFTEPVLNDLNSGRRYIEGSYEHKVLLMTHIRSVLIVEPRPIFLDILVRSIKGMLPQVSIYTTKNSVDAITKDTNKTKSSTYSFDIIIVEERLGGQRNNNIDKENNIKSPNKSLTGSEILQRVTNLNEIHENKLSDGNQKESSSCNVERAILCSKNYMGVSNRMPLLIGTSFFLGEDCKKLTKSGADVLWSKPPPKMDKVLRNKLLIALLQKRGQSEVIFS